MAASESDSFDDVEHRCKVLNLPAWATENVTLNERIAFHAENIVARGKYTYYILLSVGTVVSATVLGAAWWACPENRDTTTPQDSMFMAFQIFAIGGYDNSITGPGPVIVFTLIVLVGLILVATLIGMITENFQAFIASMNEGRSKATVKDHTLILGWGETTARAVVQIALLQSAHRHRNSTGSRRIFCWKRHRPSTPLAESRVVIMTNTLTKAEMHEQLEAAFDASSIPVNNIAIGRDIICRVGDPCVQKDLQKVGAHRAMAILVMMAGIDIHERAECDPGVRSGATTRVLLALRPLLGKPDSNSKFSLRVVADVVHHTPSLHCFDLDLGQVQGRPVFRNLLLTGFMNSLEFSCLVQPGLAFALQELLGFEGAAFRSRRVCDFADNGRDLIGKTVRDMQFMWENAIFCGIVGDGLVISADRVINDDDRLVFISDTSLPTPARVVNPFTAKGVLSASKSRREPQQVLVCGWRYEWQYPDVFASFLSEVVSNMAAGSKLVFMFDDEIGNDLSFPDLMDKAREEFSRLNCAEMVVVEESKEWSVGHMTVHYRAADPANYGRLDGVYQEFTFTDGVLLPTLTTWSLPAQSRDTRTYSILLSLRHLQHKYKKPPMHIVAEAAQECVRLLAIGPTAGDSGLRVKVPDFVDVHSISAAALVNALAYPQMFGCLAGLFSSKAGTPTLKLERADQFLEPGEYTFGVFKAAVLAKCADDILFGLRRATGEMIFAPLLHEKVTVENTDFLMLLTRRYDEEVCPVSVEASTQVKAISVSQEDQAAVVNVLPGPPVQDLPGAMDADAVADALQGAPLLDVQDESATGAAGP